MGNQSRKPNDASKFKNGDIYSFKTSPYNKFSTQNTSRYACLKILRPVIRFDKEVSNAVGFVVLDKIFTQPPSIAELTDALPLIQKRFKFGEKTPFERMSKKEPKPKYAVSSTPIEWNCELIDFTHIGNIIPNRQEEDMRTDLRSTSGWNFASSAAEGEWRWANDREILLKEFDLANAEKLERQRIVKDRYDNRLADLTWAQINNEVYFERWKESPPFPSKKFTKEIRLVVNSAIYELQNLGDKPKKLIVRKCLKKLVAEITSINIKHGYPIETEEREDIYEVFFDVTHLCQQPALMEEIGDWHYKEW